MFRIMGGGMICAATTYVGFSLADRLKKRYDFLRAMVGALQFIRSQIEFGRYDLRYIFERIDETPAFCGFFSICRSLMDDRGVQEAWKTAIDEIFGKGFLKDVDMEGLVLLAAELGMSDIRGQTKAIDASLEVLKKTIWDAKEEYDKMFKTYRGCGVLLGVFFLILFI